MIQHFGHAGHDPSIQAVAILLVEKTYFSKAELDHWHVTFEDIPLITWTKCKANTTVHPCKHTILGERGNETPVEQQVCADMIPSNAVDTVRTQPD